MICGACVKQSEPTQSKPTAPPPPIAQISPTIQNNPAAPAAEINSLMNFFALANKPTAEVEKIYGKPSFTDTKSVQLKDEAGEFRLYDKSGKRFLQVDYFKGKAVGFYLEIPAKAQTKSPEETLKLCGLDLRIADARSEAAGFLWNNPFGAKPFYQVRLSRFNDSGLYHNCEAHIKVN